MNPIIAHALYGLAWAGFGLLHSLLAAPSVKVRLAPLFGRWLRIAYNIWAALHLLFVVWAGSLLFPAPTAFRPGPNLEMAMNFCAILGLFALVAGLRGYDGKRLLGLRQLQARGKSEAEDEPLRTDGLHAFVRHPLYAGGFLLLWGLARNELALATAIWGSLYLLAGTWSEEIKLERLYGDAYRRYKEKVPAFFPWKGRALK